MAPYHRYEDDYDYDSEDSTLVNSRTSRRQRRSRYRSPSQESEDRYPRPRYSRRFSSAQSNSEEKGSGFKTFGKVALGVVFVQVVATALSHWMKRKEEEREIEAARERRRRFEKAKAKRRREENRRDRERQERLRREEEEWEASDIVEVRRIGYAPAVEESPSRERQPRSIEPPPEYDEAVDEDAFENRRKKNRSRSRPAVDVT